jgi:hypothetical protein
MTLDRDQLLARLNGESNFGLEHEREGRAAAIGKSLGRGAPGRPSQETLQMLKPWIHAVEQYAAPAKRHQEILQDLVNQWIASGNDDEGCQRPRGRDLGRAPAAKQVIMEWMSETKTFPLPRFGGGRETILQFEAHPFKADPMEAAQDEAIRMFTMLLSESACQRIAKCGNCGKYFFWKKPKPSYRTASEIYCGGCRATAGPRDRMKSRRQALHSAADALNRWRRAEGLKKKRSAAIAYIADQMGATHAWVRRNLGPIEDECMKRYSNDDYKQMLDRRKI